MKGQQLTISFDENDIRSRVPEFARTYARRPITRNEGGMQFNHAFATWYILKSLAPKVVIESGVFCGQSTWLIEQACPDAQLFALDVDFSNISYRSKRATYIQKDFSEISWADVDHENTLCFFDDHQNAYARVKDLYWAGFRRAIFEDNWPRDEGDCYSLKQMLEGVGHPELQMSKMYQGDEEARRLRREIEKGLRQFGPRQQLVVEPNTVDREMFRRLCNLYMEFPPLVLTETSPYWGVRYTGGYATKTPLYDVGALPDFLAEVMEETPEEFAYSFLAYIELKA